MFPIFMIMGLFVSIAHADLTQDYQKWHQECLNGDDVTTIDQVIERFQTQLDSDPKDHLAKVYLGSAYTLRSAESFWGPKKLEYLKRGGTLMDEAVKAAPKDPRVRFIRAVNGYKVPRRFKRRAIAVSDFLILLPLAEKGRHGLTKRERQAMLFYAWKTFSEEGRIASAERAKQACQKIDPRSWYGQETTK